MIQNLTNPKAVKAAIESDDDKSIASLIGALGALEKGGLTVSSDDSVIQTASHYVRVLQGREEQKLGPKDFKKIADLVSQFLTGP